MAVDEVLDGDLFAAVPALLCLVSASDETVNELVNGTHFADVKATAWHHLRVREGKLADLAEEHIGAWERCQLRGRRPEDRWRSGHQEGSRHRLRGS